MALQYPNMRDELVGLLKDLVRSQAAVDEWAAFPGYGFDEWFNLIDDVLPRGAEEAEGVVLKPEDVEAVAAFLSARDAVWRRLGPHASYDDYRRPGVGARDRGCAAGARRDGHHQLVPRRT